MLNAINQPGFLMCQLLFESQVKYELFHIWKCHGFDIFLKGHSRETADYLNTCNEEYDYFKSDEDITSDERNVTIFDLEMINV
jgi:hypothetical protein